MRSAKPDSGRLFILTDCHDFAVRLILQHCRQLHSDGGVHPPLTLGPSVELMLGHLDVAHQLLREDLRFLVHSRQDADAPDEVGPVDLRDREVVEDPGHHQVRKLLREEVPGLLLHP